MNDIAIVALVVTALLIIIFFLLFYIVKRTNLLMKDNFVDKLKDFDFLIDDKEKKLSELNADIADKQAFMKELEEKIEKIKMTRETNKSDDVVLPKYADYEDGNLLSGYKIIKKHFQFDMASIIEKFVKENSDTLSKDYQMYQEIRNYFQYDIIYRLSTYQPDEQYEIVSELLSEEEKNLISNILVKKGFNIKKFISKLDGIILKSNPTIDVLVGDDSLNYDYIDSRIHTRFDDSITEGFKIIYKGVIYDYSI